MTIKSLSRISLKYKDDVGLIKCVRLYFENREEFRTKCIQLSKPHLKAYISIMVANYDSHKNNAKEVLLDVKYLLNLFLTQTQSIGDNDVFNELMDVLTLSILFTMETYGDIPSSKDVLKAHMTAQSTFSDDEKIGCCQLSIAEVIYDFYPELFAQSTHSSIVKCIFSETQIVQNKSLKLIRRMLDGDRQVALLDEILGEIERNKTSKRLQCLTALSYLIECSGFSNAYTNRPSLRSYLQQEMLSTDRSAYKHALYILRKLIEIHSNGIEQTLLSGSEIRAPWETFFLIQETLDEKQSHLILPVLEQLPKTKILPMNWYYVLMTQLLRHENTIVLQCGVKYAVTNIVCDAESITSDTLMNDFFTSLMNGLNNTSVYGKSDFPTEKLKGFFAPIVDIALEKFLEINWKSVPMYYILESLADLIFDHYRHSSEQVADKFIRILRLVNKTPNVHIRKGIQMNIKRTICRISGHLSVDTFSNLVQLACIDSMKDFTYLNFDHWSQEDVVAILGHDGLGDGIKKTFLTYLEITEDDLISLMKLMKMNNYSYFNVFVVLAPLHFYTLNIWLSKSLENDELSLETTLSMYYLLYIINDRQGNYAIIDRLRKKVELKKLEKMFEDGVEDDKKCETDEENVPLVSIVSRKVVSEEHLTKCLAYLSENIPWNYERLITKLIECGTEQAVLVVLDMLEVSVFFFGFSFIF